ncbi:hypothetical protein MPSEU_000548900 [Mayamaea pseudoterrestris]|nr:hypothetical protein MPSEU_000548900 [Mayamaea pseudoterrestris]
MAETSTETIALFGGTGRTGRHVLTCALEKGYKVRMLARSPDKVAPKTHANLTVIKGDLTDAEALKEVVKGATYVICCVSGPHSNTKYPKDMMINFIKLLLPIMDAEASIKLFLYQAGGFSAAPSKPNSFVIKLMGKTIGTMLGLGPMIRDNEQVTFYIAESKKHFDFIVTRPGMLEEKDKEVVAVAEHDKFPMSTITFKALAEFTVTALKDTSLYNTCPYVTAKK